MAKQEGPQVRSRLPTSQQLHRQTVMDLLSKACSFQGQCLESTSQSVLVSVSFRSSSPHQSPGPGQAVMHTFLEQPARNLWEPGGQEGPCPPNFRGLHSDRRRANS